MREQDGKEDRVRSRTAISVLGGRAKLLPQVAALGPLGILQAGEMQLFFFQGAVSERADIFNSRAPQQQHAAPGYGGDGHAQPAKANATPVPLIPDAEVKQAGRD